MKRILFLLLGLAIAVSATAGVDTWRQQRDALKQKKTGTVLTNRFKSQARSHQSQLRDAVPEVIWEQPEGDLVVYSHSSYRISNYDEPLFNSNPVDIVYAPDNETVYLRGLVSSFYTSWISGYISDGKIHVPLGQYLEYDEDFMSGVQLLWGSCETLRDCSRFYCGLTPDWNVTEVTFTIDDDKIIMDNTTVGDYGDGATGLAAMGDDGTSYFVMECNTVLSPLVEPVVIMDQPEGRLVTCERGGIYYLDGSFYEQEGTVDIVYAPDGKTVYIKDIMSNIENGSWVYGTIENDKIHVPMNQCIFWDSEYYYGIMLAFGQVKYNESNWYEYIDYDPDLAEATFSIVGDKIYLDNTSFATQDQITGATVLAIVWTDDPVFFLQCDLNTVFTLPPMEENPGDVNGDSLVNITDVILLINYLSNGSSVSIVEANSDLNNDNVINITDVIRLISILASGSN